MPSDPENASRPSGPARPPTDPAAPPGSGRSPRAPGPRPSRPELPAPPDPAESSAIEHATKARFARFVLAIVGLVGVAALAENLRQLLTAGNWQYAITSTIALGYLGVAAHGFGVVRRGPIGPAIERMYIAIAVVIGLAPLWFEQVETMFAAAFIFFVLVTAPRLLSLERADRWVYVAVVTGIITSAAELLPLPTRLPPELQYDLPFELTVLTAMTCFALLAFRDSRRFPVRTKLVLAFLVIALGPLAILSYDASSKVVAAQQASSRDELGDGAATTAFLWASWFDHQRERLTFFANSPSVVDACDGDPAAVEHVSARMQPLLEDLRGVALWSVSGRRLAAAGAPPDRPLAPGAFVGHGSDGGLVLAHTACDGGSLTIALQADALNTWTRAAAQRHHAAIVVRDAGGNLMAGVADPALLAALPAAKDLSQKTFSVNRAIVEAEAPAKPEVLHLSEAGQLAAVAPIEPVGWSIALLRDESDLHAAVARQKREVHVFTLLAAMFAAIAALLLGHALGAPLRRLSAALTRFSSGETAVRAEVGSHDEIGMLSKHFNKMAAQVGGLLDSLAQQTQRLQAEVAVRAAQEDRLQVLNLDLSAARDQALAANRAKSTFLAHMSHELRTPLNAIIGYGELIEEILEERNFTDIADDTRNIVRSAHHLLTIINDILDLSKIEAGKLDMVVEEFDVAALAHEVAETVAPMISANGDTLVVRIDAADTHMRSDRTKLRQALLNLLSNAAKFTEHGKVELRLRHETVAGVPCHIFSVRDEGVGIPEGALSTLFDPFTQVTYPQVRKRSGTGLGLAITRRLCWMMGGEIDVESVAGEGSTFTLWIPSVYRSLGSSESWRPLRDKRRPGKMSGPMPAFKP